MLKTWGSIVCVFAAITAARAGCNSEGTYVAASGDLVKTPRCAGEEAVGAHFLCRDGSFSHSETKRGACSRHGGVEKSLDSK